MEQRILRFAQIIAIATAFLSILILLDEILPPSHIYGQIATREETISKPLTLSADGELYNVYISEINKDLSPKTDVNIFCMWVEQLSIKNLVPAEPLIVYTTPLLNKPRYIINESMINSMNYTIQSFTPNKDSRFFIIPFILLIISLASIKTKMFELKIGLVFFSIILSMAMQWFWE